MGGCVNTHMKGNQGFTLINMIVMVVILGILAVIPASRGLISSSFQPPVAAEKLVYDIRYAQQLAMSIAARCGVDFDIAANAYTVFQGTPATPVTDPVHLSPYIVQYGTDVYSEVTLSSASFNGSSTLIFDSRGTPLDGTGAVLISDGLVILNGTENLTITRQTGLTKRS